MAGSGPGGSRKRAGSSPAVRAEQPVERVRGDVACDLRILLEAPQRVAIPALAERDVDAQPMTIPYEPLRGEVAHSEQHLELVLVSRKPALGHEPLALGQQELVVSRNRGVRAG